MGFGGRGSRVLELRSVDAGHGLSCSEVIFCLVDLSIGMSGVLKSPTIIVLLLISPFILVYVWYQRVFMGAQDGGLGG